MVALSQMVPEEHERWKMEFSLHEQIQNLKIFRQLDIQTHKGSNEKGVMIPTPFTTSLGLTSTKIPRMCPVETSTGRFG